MGKQILLIEDNEKNLYLATFLLEKHGHEVVSAPDGPGGIAMANQPRPALILLDIQLPGMDGYAVVRALRADATFKDTPIVAVTSFAMMSDRALAAGCDGYIEKPIGPEIFVAECERFLRPPRTQAGAT